MKYMATSAALLWLLTLSSEVLESNAFSRVSRARFPRVTGSNLSSSEDQHRRRIGTSMTTTSATATATAIMKGSRIGTLRGGASAATTVTGAIAGTLAAGPLGILGLATIASSVVMPLALYREAYAFTLGYALCFGAMGLCLIRQFGLVSGPAASLATAAVFYGIRLGSFLFLRELSVNSKKEVILSLDKTPRLKRIPFSLSVALFYAFMMTPALYLCRATAGSGSKLSETATTIANFGAGLAWFGAIVEAWTDGHKFWTKRGKDGNIDFHGPSTWWFGISRHPNYLGELLFWSGIFVGGLPSFFVNVVREGTTTIHLTAMGWGPAIALVCSALGLSGITAIMLGATNRLEGKHDVKYGGQMPFEEWKSQTSKLAPTLKNVRSAKSLLRAILPVSVAAGCAVLVSKAALKVLAAV